jgi:hypothetical protein
MCGASDTAHLSMSETPREKTGVVDPSRYTYHPGMPSQLTRVNLSLPDDVIRVLDRMGKVTGAGRATIIREWMIEGAPMFAEMATAMEMASRKNLDGFKVIADVLGDMSAEVVQLSLYIKKKRRAAMRKKVK